MGLAYLCPKQSSMQCSEHRLDAPAEAMTAADYSGDPGEQSSPKKIEPFCLLEVCQIFDIKTKTIAEAISGIKELAMETKQEL